VLKIPSFKDSAILKIFLPPSPFPFFPFPRFKEKKRKGRYFWNSMNAKKVSAFSKDWK